MNPYGVNFVMDSFFKCMTGNKVDIQQNTQAPIVVNTQYSENDVFCEEELLEAFEGGK